MIMLPPQTLQAQSLEQQTAIRFVNDRTLMYEIEGPIQLEQFLWLTEAQTPYIDEMVKRNTPWAVIVVLHVSSHMAEDCHGVSFGRVLELREQGLLPYCASCVISPNTIGYGSMEAVYADLHVTMGTVFTTHSDISSALAWTSEQLEEINHSNPTHRRDNS